jgi:hypothetical protein
MYRLLVTFLLHATCDFFHKLRFGGLSLILLFVVGIIGIIIVYLFMYGLVNDALISSYYKTSKPITVPARSKYGMNRLRPLKHWNRGFESHSWHGCLCTFILCVGSGLVTG